MDFDVVIVAAGESTRAGGGKMEFAIAQQTVLERTVGVFFDMEEVKRIVIVSRESDLDFVKAVVGCFDKNRFKLVLGGKNRCDSVANGLAAVTAEGVLIHDGARPFVSPILVRRVIAAVEEFGSGVPSLPLSDSVRIIKDNLIVGEAERANLGCVQTPQGFRTADLRKAFELGAAEINADESALYSKYIAPVRAVEGDERNEKITTLGDYVALNSRVGTGYDLHRLVRFRKLILGGVEIPFELGSEAFSDGDVIVHALIDAILSAIGERDIGYHFPDGNPEFLDIDSTIMLTQVMHMCRENNYKISSVSIIVVAEKPKLSDYIPIMRVKLANVVGIPSSMLTISAKTNEGLGDIGAGKAIAAYATVVVC